MTAGSPKEVVRRVADGILEATVIGSFTEIGPMVRSRLFGWDPR